MFKLIKTVPAPVAGDKTKYAVRVVHRTLGVMMAVAPVMRLDGRQGRQCTFLNPEGQWQTVRLNVGESFQFFKEVPNAN